MSGSLHVQPGQSVRGAVRKLSHAISSRADVQSGPGVRRHQYRNGSVVVAEQRTTAFRGRFFVTISNAVATISTGMVDGVEPWIDGVPIGGDEKNKAPELKIIDGPNEHLRSWICVVARVDAETKKLPEDDVSALVVEHRSSLIATPPELLLPLAMIVWLDEESISRLEQIVYFDQQLVAAGDRVRFAAAS